MNLSDSHCIRSLNVSSHQHLPEKEKEIREAALDETLKETFPASDPPSSIPNPDQDELLGAPERNSRG